MRIADTVDDSIVDGTGLRFVVFVQGCLRICPGCHNPQTQDPSGGYEVSTDELFAHVANNPLCDGLTLSGGEPFAQAAECAELAGRVRALGKTVWCYSGYTLEELTEKRYGRKKRPISGQEIIDEFKIAEYVPESDIRALLANIDVLIDGAFIIAKKDLNLKWRGSSNQRILEQYKPGKWREVML